MDNAPSRRKRGRARAPEAKQELRAHILREATKLFVELGYDAFSMRKLADRIGYTAAAIYSHYVSKEDLLAAIIGEGYEKLQTYLDVGAGPPAARLRHLGIRYLDFAFENPELYRLMFIVRPKALFDLDDARVAQRLEGLRRVTHVLEEEPVRGYLRPLAPSKGAEATWAFVHGLAALALTVPIFGEAWARETLEAVMVRLEA